MIHITIIHKARLCVYQAIIFLIVIIINFSCSESTEDAIRELSRRDIPYNQEEFAKNTGEWEDDIIRLFLDAGMDPDTSNQEGNTALMSAASKGNITAIEILLEAGADVNAQNKNGESPLWFACAKGQHDIIELLLRAGSNVNMRNKKGETPLWNMMRNKNYNAFQMLIDAGADVNLKNKSGLTLLWLVIDDNKDIKAIKLLISAGANVNIMHPYAVFPEGTTPLWASLDNEELMRILLDAGADINETYREKGKDINQGYAMIGHTPLTWAISRKKRENINLLLELEADVNAMNDQGMTGLMVAANENRHNLIPLLLSAGAEVNTKKYHDEKKIFSGLKSNEGETALMMAAYQGKLTAARFLLEAGADVNAQSNEGFTALMRAVLRQNTDITKLLLEAGADVNMKNYNDNTAFLIAASQCNIGIMRILLEFGADMYVVDKQNHTALVESIRISALSGNTSVIDFIIKTARDQKRDISELDLNGAIISAMKQNNIEIVETLIDFGADVNRLSKSGELGLIVAISQEDINLVKKFFSLGADVNACDAEGKTALMKAAFKANIDILRLLLEHGADMYSKDKRGCTALLKAALKGDVRVIKLLIDAGGNINQMNISGILTMAMANHQNEFIRELINLGADVDSQSETYKAPLIAAAKNSNFIEALKIFLSAGANVNVKDVKGTTPLMEAGKYGNIDAVKILLDAGADIQEKDMDGKTAMMYASDKGYTNIVALLKKYVSE